MCRLEWLWAVLLERDHSGTMGRKKEAGGKQTSRRRLLALLALPSLLSFPAKPAEQRTLVISVNRYASLLKGALFQIRIGGELMAPAETGAWLQPDEFGRIRLSGLPLWQVLEIGVTARLPDGDTFVAECGTEAPVGDALHILVQPTSRVENVVTRTSDRPNRVVETMTPRRVPTGITISPATTVPSISG